MVHESEEGELLSMLQQQFSDFNTPNFDVAKHTSQVLAGSQTTAQAQLEKMREGTRLLDNALASEVTGKSPELFGHVRRMRDTEASLADVVLSVETLQSAVRRIRAEVAGPYEHIRARTRQLRNLHSTIGLLRHLIHRLKLVHKLQAQMAAPPESIDLAKAAKLLTDIRAVDSSTEFAGVEAVAADEAFLLRTSALIHEQAQAALAEGMATMSQARVGSALQVFFNLDELSQAVRTLLSGYLQNLEKTARAALDSKQLTSTEEGSATAGGGGSGLAGAQGGVRGGAAASWQDKLWSGLKELADGIVTSTTAVWHLQRVVAKKKDPLSHVCFLDALVPPDQPLLCQQFWDDLVRMLLDVFTAASKPSTKTGFVRDALVAGYPKLAYTFEAMFERLAFETTMKGVTPAVTQTQLQQLLGATSPMQGAYLAISLNRMSEAVTAAFPGGARSLPSPADVQKCIGVIHDELKVGGISPQLAALVATTSGTALALLSEKAEYMAATGPEVRAVSHGAPASAAQARNIALCSQLQEVHRSLSSLLPKLPQTAAPALGASLEVVQATAIEIVAPIFKSAVETLENYLLQMHNTDFSLEGASDGPTSSGTSAVGVVDTSRHVTAAAMLISHFRSEFLSKFVPLPSPNVPSCVGALVERMAARMLIFFVRHASLVRPLGHMGKLQLAKDMAELQLAVGSSLYPLEQLGQPYRILKAFRSLLFTETSSILSSPLLRELPPSVTAHHIFSRLPAEVQAPHERSGLTAAQYSLWLDTHSTEEALAGGKQALDASEPQWRASPEAAGIVGIILQLC